MPMLGLAGTSLFVRRSWFEGLEACSLRAAARWPSVASHAGRRKVQGCSPGEVTELILASCHWGPVSPGVEGDGFIVDSKLFLNFLQPIFLSLMICQGLDSPCICCNAL